MIDRDEAYKETDNPIDTMENMELERLGSLILDYYVSERYFSLTCKNVSESTIDVLEEKRIRCDGMCRPFRRDMVRNIMGTKKLKGNEMPVKDSDYI